ncbi:potassium channel family protein [Myxosarcina sp. GI1]|uniref:potassium channel family protein n=1 Tax=Myxosarcina sp. GI1 TaxID=1541065 RepID=UPI00068D03B9|nr:potassium channel family protein [Myxosarcina sp. GI1]
MTWLTQTVGVVLIAIAMVDIFITVLYPRTGNSLLSMPISKGTWNIFRQVARWSKNDRLLSYCGSVILIIVAIVWIALFVIGFALFLLPALGTGIQATQGKIPTDFGTAVYYSGFNFTTLGVGDLVPKNTVYRLVTILEAALGFATFTVSLTYLLSVLNALTQRNVFALSLHHRTGSRANATELLLGWGTGGKFDRAKADITYMTRDLLHLLESHHSYPVLHYFRFHEAQYSLARMTLITMDTAALLKSALDPQQYRDLIDFTGI